jgi:hypothetical protein
MTELEKITQALLDETDSMWRKNELTTEEYYAARAFVRKYEQSITSKSWKIMFK